MSVRRTSNKTKGGYWLRFLGFANRARAPLRWARAQRTSSFNRAWHIRKAAPALIAVPTAHFLGWRRKSFRVGSIQQPPWLGSCRARDSIGANTKEPAGHQPSGFVDLIRPFSTPVKFTFGQVLVKSRPKAPAATNASHPHWNQHSSPRLPNPMSKVTALQRRGDIMSLS